MEAALGRRGGGVQPQMDRESDCVFWMQVVNFETKHLVLGSTTTSRTIVLNDPSSLILALAADAAGSDW